MSHEYLISSTPNTNQIIMDNYVSILEKTNNQLSLWWNPYGVMVGVLGVFIAIIEIAVGYALWKYSYEQKKRVDEFFNRHEKLIKEKYVEEQENSKKRKENAKEYEKDLNSLIQSYKEKLNNVSKENKAEIKRLEEDIKELSKSKASLSNYEIPIVEEYTGMGMLLRDYVTFMKCQYCGEKFQYKDNSILQITGSVLKQRIVRCPHCNTDNIIN